MPEGVSTGDGKYGNVSFGPMSRHQVQKAATAGTSPYKEIGRTGLRQWGGYILEEWLSELHGKRGAEFYRELADTDAIIGGVLMSIEVLVRKVTWWIEPASSDPAEIERQDFLEDVFFEDLNVSWSDTISEILSFLTYGYYLGEECYKRRADGRVGLAKIATRAQDSLLHWEFDTDTDEWTAFVQQPPPTYTTYRIPREKALLFRTRVHKNNPEGRSLLRNCVKSFYYKKSFEALMGIGAERDLAGLPMLTPPDTVDIWNTNDTAMVQLLSQAQSFVSQVRRDEMEGVVKPNGWEFELMKGGGSRSFNLLDIIRYYDEAMARSLLADVITMGGDKATGSYALSNNKRDLFNGAIEAHLDQIASVFNTDAIPRLYRLNGMDAPNGYARLCHGPAEEVDLTGVAQVLTAAGAAGAPLFTGDTNDKLLDWLLDKIGAPSLEAGDTSEGE